MSDPTVFETLRGIEFFRGIADEHLERFAKISQPVEFPLHSYIFREKDRAKNVYLIVSGRVSLIICDPDVGCRELMTVSDGDLIGWSPLLGRKLLSDTARTMTATKAFAIDGEQVLALCREDPQFGFEFMHRAAQVLAERLSATRLQHLRMSGRQLPNVQIESD
jgi:CRP-like cAMP-binding protein